MKIYLVGGAVRDALMGKTPKDMDYVVVGATEQDMLNRGFQKVGAAFPVFLNPINNFEYALARKEKKVEDSGAGAHGSFEFDIADVSLEEDLKRRDLTINAMAQSTKVQSFDYMEIIDPYGGLKDLENKVLRHVSEAFAEDPLRVLRVARFAARYPEFTVAPETMDIMRIIVQSDEFKTLSQERIFKEMEGALKCSKPSIFFNVLKDVGGLDHYFPELKALIDVPQRVEYHPEGDCWVHTMLVLDHAAQMGSIEITYAALVHDLGKGITPAEILPGHHGHEDSGVPLVKAFSERLKVPNNLLDAGILVTKNHLRVHRISEMKPSSVVRMFYEMDAFRKPHLIHILARACEADDMGKNRVEVKQGILLEQYFNVVKDIGFKDIRSDLTGEKIGHEIRALRVRSLKRYVGAKEDEGKT